MTSLKTLATKGMIWSALDKFAVQAGQFIIGVVLARLLLPSDYGLIGMLSIFMAISQTFIDSGMGSGLIQKQDRTDIDYSTVFIFNLGVSVLFYILLFLSAPLISDFYDVPELISLTRVLSITIIINALTVVQRTKLTIAIDFKTLAKVNVFSVLISGIIAIYLAYNGLGVWALVVQSILRALFSSITIWFYSKWTPSIIFSFESFKRLFGFGSKLLAAGLYAMSFREIYNITIGKVYSSSDLGYYNRALSFAELTSGTITSILQQVTYPVLASLQNDKERMISVYSRLLRMTAFFVFPSMTLLALLADPLVMVLLTEKWAPVIVLLQWLSFARFFYPLSAINMNILNAIGRSDLFLLVDLSKAPLTIITLIVTIPLGIKEMAIGMVFTSSISFFINAYMPGKLFGYGGFRQLKDLLPVFLATALMSVVVYFGIFFIESDILKILIGVALGFLSYLFLVYFMKLDELKEVIILLRKLKR